MWYCVKRGYVSAIFKDNSMGCVAESEWSRTSSVRASLPLRKLTVFERPYDNFANHLIRSPDGLVYVQYSSRIRSRTNRSVRPCKHLNHTERRVFCKNSPMQIFSTRCWIAIRHITNFNTQSKSSVVTVHCFEDVAFLVHVQIPSTCMDTWKK